uniref:GRIP domain-containing protein n=2 Tax=Lygus hesperus TaxID=30085 RepID=A0A146MAQ3_LYGHE
MTEARRMSKRRDSGGSEGGPASRIPISYTPVLPRKQKPPSLERHRSLHAALEEIDLAMKRQCLSSNGLRGRSPRLDDDNESLRSGISCCSNTSNCEHAHFARNGTTYSGRTKKYIVHCSPTHGEPEKYITPTQRATTTIRRLQSQLSLSQAEIQEKEQEIARLTRELVELRLGKAELDSPVHDPLSNGHSSRNGGGDIDRLSVEVGRISVETTPCSLADSGHFEDISPAVSPRNTPHSAPHTPNFAPHVAPSSSQSPHIAPSSSHSPHIAPLAIHSPHTGHHSSPHSPNFAPQTTPRSPHFPSQPSTNGRDSTDSAVKNHAPLLDHVKSQEVINAKIESLLHRLAEANDRYYELRPQYDDLKRKLDEVEREKDILKTKFTESEERHRQTYLQMFNKGQEAALFAVDQGTSDGPPKAATLPQLLKELEVTKAELESVKTMYRRLLESKKTKSEQDAEVTLQFLKSAVYYFLTDRENATGHLAAIQSILGFSGDEKSAIEKASYSWK